MLVPPVATFLSVSSHGLASACLCPNLFFLKEHQSYWIKTYPSDLILGFPGGSETKESTFNAGDLGSIPRPRRSPGEGNGNPLQYTCLENPIDRGAWGATVPADHRVRHDWAINTFSDLIFPSSLKTVSPVKSHLRFRGLQHVNPRGAYFSSVQLLSHVWLFGTLGTSAHQGSLSITNSRSPPKPMSIESVIPSNHLILCHPFLFLPSIFPSIWVFSKESALHIRWPKYWSFSFNISPTNEHPGLISFRMDWLDLLAVQETLKSLLQHHSSKHQFFGPQLSSQSNSHIHTWLLEKP